MTNFERRTNDQLDRIISMLDKIISLLQDKEEDKPLELEDHNFKINSDGWEKITMDGKIYLQNKEKDVWEFLEGECKGEQLFTYDAAIRETKKAGKIMPTDKQLSELLKSKEDLKNVIYPGNRDIDGSFGSLGSYLLLWSFTPFGWSNAWFLNLSSSYSTIIRSNGSRACGFSVRCLK